MSCFPKIDFSWTLFLDRDGVINKKIEDDYVKSIDEFELLPNVLDAMKLFSTRFHKIIIVTNQQGIGKQVMTEMDLTSIHNYLKNKVESNGGRIDAIYHASQLASEKPNMRKPNIGMAKLAQSNFPSIKFQKSIMVGDSISDMEFAQNNNMFGVFIGQSDNYFSLNSLGELRDLLK